MDTLRDIMTEEVVTTSPEGKLSEVVSVMADKNISCVVVIENGRPVGIITERDLSQKILSKQLNPVHMRAKDIMTSPILSVSPDTEYNTAIDMMETNHIRRVAIVEDHKLVGLVTGSDIMSKSKNINSYNKRLLFYQNVQTYVIFLFFAFIVMYFVFQILL